MKRFLLAVLLAVLPAAAMADAWPSSQPSAGPAPSWEQKPAAVAGEPLPVEQAFAVGLRESSPGQLDLTLTPAEGYGIYLDQVDLNLTKGWKVVKSPDAASAHWKHDDISGGQRQVYTSPVRWVLRASPDAAPGAGLKMQGCLFGKICYPPVQWVFNRAPSGWSAQVGTPPIASRREDSAPASPAAPAEKATGFSWVAFLAAGLLLALAPCTLPLVPVAVLMLCPPELSASRSSRVRRLAAYTAGHAGALAMLGGLLAWAGVNLRLWVQGPVFQIVATVLLAALVLGMMFGWPRFRARWSMPSINASSLPAAFAIGVVAVLMAGACTAPVLAAALLDVAQHSSASEGMLRLGLLGALMTWPLWAYGLLNLRVKPGVWSARLQWAWVAALGLVAVTWALRWLSPVQAAVFGALAIFAWATVVAGAFQVKRPALATGALLASVLALSISLSPVSPIKWQTVRTEAELASAVQAATNRGCPVVVQVSADWCAECSKMERDSFSRPELQQGWSSYETIKLDVSSPSEDLQRVLRDHQLVGPPATLWMAGAKEKLQEQGRIIGSASAQQLLAATPIFSGNCRAAP